MGIDSASMPNSWPCVWHVTVNVVPCLVSSIWHQTPNSRPCCDTAKSALRLCLFRPLITRVLHYRFSIVTHPARARHRAAPHASVWTASPAAQVWAGVLPPPFRRHRPSAMAARDTSRRSRHRCCRRPSAVTTNCRETVAAASPRRPCRPAHRSTHGPPVPDATQHA